MQFFYPEFENSAIFVQCGLGIRTQREVGKQNQYEKEWKIKTNMKKFSVVPVLRKKNPGTIAYF